MSELTQQERLFARIKKLLKENPCRVLHLTILADGNGEPLLWFIDEPVKVEGKKEIKEPI